MISQMTRRLLFLTERYPPDLGGVAASSARIVAAIASLGVQVDVLAWSRSLQPGQVAADEGNPAVHRMGRFREWDSTLPHASNLCDYLFARSRYDAVWGHYLTPAGFFAVWIARRYSVPSVVSIRGNDLDRDLFPPGDFARLEWTLRNATRVTAVTRELAAKVEAVCPDTNPVYLPNAVDSQTFAPAPPDPQLRAALGVQPDEAVLAFAGELREKKGLRFLLDCLVQLRQRRPACLLLIGEVRPSELPQLIPYLGTAAPADHRILITGQLATPADVNRHLQLCDVYLQPSLWDGMPNALLEAMAAGCGSIGSDAGGIPEIIAHRENGLIVPRWELHRLAEIVHEWLDADHAWKTQIRQAARSTATQHFTRAGERARLQSLLDGLTPKSA